MGCWGLYAWGGRWPLGQRACMRTKLHFLTCGYNETWPHQRAAAAYWKIVARQSAVGQLAAAMCAQLEVVQRQMVQPDPPQCWKAHHLWAAAQDHRDSQLGDVGKVTRLCKLAVRHGRLHTGLFGAILGRLQVLCSRACAHQRSGQVPQSIKYVTL